MKTRFENRRLDKICAIRVLKSPRQLSGLAIFAHSLDSDLTWWPRLRHLGADIRRNNYSTLTDTRFHTASVESGHKGADLHACVGEPFENAVGGRV